jgi:hypothetical protein
MKFQTSQEQYYEQQNIGPSQEYEQQNDNLEYESEIDGEGFVEPPRNGRAGNYTMDEDILLCITWKQVGMDATVNTDQKGDTYWTRKEFFDAHNKSEYVRTCTSLRSWWVSFHRNVKNGWLCWQMFTR